MNIDPGSLSQRDSYQLLVSVIVPRPIAFVSTVAEDGVLNLAPFSFFTGICAKPPTICFSVVRRRGLKKDTALKVAQELSEHDALGAHIRDELGINEISQAKPMQAALASGAAFTFGGLLPFLVTLFLPLYSMEYSLYGFAIFFLIILGALAAKTGGSNIKKAVIRITFWGTLAMGLTALVGYMFNVSIG